MMSIRGRLILLCVLVSLLPAIPLSFVVRSLLEKSFNIGLSPTVEEALQSGLSVSRDHLAALHAAFEEDVFEIVEAAGGISGGSSLDGSAGGAPIDSVAIARTISTARAGKGIDGFVIVPAAGSKADEAIFKENPSLAELTHHTAVIERAAVSSEGPQGMRFFETDDRAVQLALWSPGAANAAANGDHRSILFFERTDSEFLAEAARILEGRQIFAQLQLRRGALGKSFFYPFIVIYAAILALSVSVALLTAERMAAPIRRLAEGAKAVAAGDWAHRIAVRSGGEIGALVRAFNEMVSRLDAQSRRLADMEKMAAWRDVARHLAHEIKNPLLPIRLTVEELKDQYRGTDETFRTLVDESARVVGDEIDHLQNLVKEFSSFARMPEPRFEAGSVEALARDVVKLYPRVTARVEAEAPLPEITFDPDQIRRALVNLMDNAISVAREDAPVEVRIRIARALSPGGITIAVSDNGPGIPEEIRHRIFDPYFTTRPEGSGLGLAVVKNIVLMHGGSIEVTSAPGEGATFTITLPADRTARGGREDKEVS